jgi:hypothetical protein
MFLWLAVVVEVAQMVAVAVAAALQFRVQHSQ